MILTSFRQSIEKIEQAKKAKQALDSFGKIIAIIESKIGSGREWRDLAPDRKAHIVFDGAKFKPDDIKSAMAQYEALGWRCDLETKNFGEFPTRDYRHCLTMY